MSNGSPPAVTNGRFTDVFGLSHGPTNETLCTLMLMTTSLLPLVKQHLLVYCTPQPHVHVCVCTSVSAL